MANSSIVATGDLHGRYDLLKTLLKEVLPQVGNARPLFLGDYIDRGPDSAQVIETLIKLRQKRPDAVFLMGNHEKALLKLLDSPGSGYWAENFLLNGGQATLDSYGLGLNQLHKLPAHHKKFLRSLPLYWHDDKYLFVHGGLRPKIALNRQSPQDLLTIREQFYNSNYRFSHQVVFGHTPFKRPLIKNNCLGIDTGAVYGQYLTSVWLPHMKFFRIDSDTSRLQQAA